MTIDTKKHCFRVVSSDGGEVYYLSTLAGACSHLLERRKGRDKGGYVDDGKKSIGDTSTLQKIAASEVDAYLDELARAARMKGQVQ